MPKPAFVHSRMNAGRGVDAQDPKRDTALVRTIPIAPMRAVKNGKIAAARVSLSPQDFAFFKVSDKKKPALVGPALIVWERIA